MAELELRIKANYEDAIKCRERLKEVEKELQNLSSEAPAEKIAKLTKEYAELTNKWQNSMSFIGKTGAYFSEAMKSIAGVIRGAAKETEDLGKENENSLSAVEKRLSLEKRIQEELERQKKSIQEKVDYYQQGLERNQKAYDEVKEKMDAKYGNKERNLYSAEDNALLGKGESTIEKWSTGYDDAATKLEIIENLLAASTERSEKLKESLSEVGRGESFNEMSSRIEESQKKVEDLQKSVDELNKKKSNIVSEIKDYDTIIEKGQEDDIDAYNEAISKKEEALTKLDEVNNILQQETGRLEDAKNQLEESRNVASQIEDSYKGFAQSIDSALSNAKVFIDESMFNRYHELGQQIENLKSEITQKVQSGDFSIEEIEQLQEELHGAQEEFRELDAIGNRTAEMLGTSLATRVSQALTRFYELNNQTREAQRKFDELSDKVKRANEELGKEQTPDGLVRAKAEADALQQELDKARDTLSKLRGDERDALREVESINNSLNAEETDGEEGAIADVVSSKMKGLMGTITSIAGIGFSISQLGGFFDKVKETRSYFQDIESSMKVFLGSAEKGAEFTQKLKDYAYYNMFEFRDLAAASQQMISYGQDIDDIIPRIDQLSNIAVGTHGSLMELVDAYNRAKATGVVDARGIQQWAVKGVMIRDVLKELGEKGDTTRVTFEQLNKVLEHVTGEGGMFHDLQKSMMENISAEEGQLGDNLDAMYNEIGEKYEGVIVKLSKLKQDMAASYEEPLGGFLDFGLDAANWALDELKENWKGLVQVIKYAISVYGAYKVAVMSLNGIQKLQTMWKTAEITARRLNQRQIAQEATAKAIETGAETTNTAAKEMNAKATGKQAGASVAHTGAIEAETAALNTQSGVMGKNSAMSVLLTKGFKGIGGATTLWAAGLAAAGFLFYKIYDDTLSLEEAHKAQAKAIEAYNDELKESSSAAREHLAIIQDQTKSIIEQSKAYDELIKTREIFEKYSVDELKNMSPESITALLSEDDANKADNYYRNQIEALKEFQAEYGGGFAAAFANAEGDFLEKLAAKYNLGEEWAKQMDESIGGMTDLSRWADTQIQAATENLENSFRNSSEKGIIAGIRSGLLNSDMRIQTDEMIENFSKAYIKASGYDEAIKNKRQEVRDANGWGVNYQSRKELKQLQEDQKKAEASARALGDRYTEQLTPALEEAEKKVKDLRLQMDAAEGTKKAELQVELKEAQTNRDYLKEVIKFFESGGKDSEYMMKFKIEIEYAELSDEEVFDISDAYQKAEDKATEYLIKMDDIRRKANEDGKVTAEEARKLADSLSVTTQNITSDFTAMSDSAQKKIEELRVKLDNTTDPNKKRNIEIQIKRYEEIKNGIEILRSKLVTLASNPYNIAVNVTGSMTGWLRKLLSGEGTGFLGNFFGGAFSNLFGNSKAAKENAAERRVKEEEKKKTNNTTPTGGKGGGKGGGKDDKEARRAQEIADEMKYQKELLDLERKNRRTREDATIAEIKNEAIREHAERVEKHRQTLEDYDIQTEDILQKIYEQRKRVYERQNKGKHYELDKQGGIPWYQKDKNGEYTMMKTLTKEEKKYFGLNIGIIDSNKKIENAVFDRYEQKRIKDFEKTRYEFLSKYGNFYEQQLAITEEYEEKIKEAVEGNDPWKAASLEQERDEKISSARLEDIKQSMDWDGLFNDLERYSADYLLKIRNQLKTLLNDENLDVEDKKIISEKISNIDDVRNEKLASTFRLVNNFVEEQKRLQEELAEATKRREQAEHDAERAYDNVADAEENIIDYLADNDIDEILDFFPEDTNPAEKRKAIMDKLGGNLGDMPFEDFAEKMGIEKGTEEFDALEKMFIKLKAAQAKLITSTSELTKAETQEEHAKEEADIKLAERISGWMSGVNEWVQKYLGDLPGLLDTLGIGGSEQVQKGLDAVNDAAGAAQDYMSGNYVGAAMKGINAVNNFGEALGLWSNSNVEESEKEIERLINSNTELGKALDNLRDELKNINISDTSTYEKAKGVANAQIANAMRATQTKMAEYDGHHSTNYYSGGATSILRGIAEKAMKEGIIDTKNLKGVGNINEILKILSPEELDKLRTFDPQGWTKFMEALRKADKANLGAADSFLEYVDTYSDLMDDLEKEWKETVTNLSWDSLKSSFASALEDMKKDVNDWSNDLEDIFRSGVSNYLSTNYTDTTRDPLTGKPKGLLAQWYDKYFEAMQSGNLDAHEIADLRKEYLDIVQEATAERDKLYDTLGIVNTRDQQSATANSAMSVTYDQADALVGILLNHTILFEQAAEERTILNATAGQILYTGKESRDIAADSRDILAGMAIHVEEIRDGVVDTIVPKITTIEDEIVRIRKIVTEQ